MRLFGSLGPFFPGKRRSRAAGEGGALCVTSSATTLIRTQVDRRGGAAALRPRRGTRVAVLPMRWGSLEMVPPLRDNAQRALPFSARWLAIVALTSATDCRSGGEGLRALPR